MKILPVPSEAELETLLRESATMEDAPSHLIHRAESLWTPRRPQASAPSPLRRLLAMLTLDDAGASGLALGLRGDASPTRQWLFTCEEHDFDLRAEAVDDTRGGLWQLSGQVLGPESPGELQLYAESPAPQDADVPLRRAALGELSDFRCEDLPGGRYRAVFLLGDRQVELPTIELGDGAPPLAAA